MTALYILYWKRVAVMGCNYDNIKEARKYFREYLAEHPQLDPADCKFRKGAAINNETCRWYKP